MREIKFRAWNIEEKIMCYDNEDNSACYWDGVVASNVGLVNSQFRKSKGYKERYEYMQYTGLKDKNGMEIYEGDILKFEDGGEEGYEYQEGYDFVNTAAVCFSDGRFELTNFGTTNSTVYEEMHGSDHEEFILNFELAEVIGNIYQDKELLNQN